MHGGGVSGAFRNMRDTEDEWAYCPLSGGQYAVHVGVVVLIGVKCG